MMMTMINNGELWKQFSGYYTIQFPPHIPISWSPFDFGWMMMMKIIVMMVFMIMIMHKIWIVIIAKIFFTYFLLCVDRERKKPRSLSAWSRVTWINLIVMKIVNVIVKETIMIMMITMMIIKINGQKFCSPETGSPAAWTQFSLHPDDNDHDDDDYDNSAQQMILYGPPSLSHC